MHSAYMLKDKALKFVRENTNEVLGSIGWVELEAEIPRLAASVLKVRLPANVVEECFSVSNNIFLVRGPW